MRESYLPRCLALWVPRQARLFRVIFLGLNSGYKSDVIPSRFLCVTFGNTAILLLSSFSPPLSSVYDPSNLLLVVLFTSLNDCFLRLL